MISTTGCNSKTETLPATSTTSTALSKEQAKEFDAELWLLIEESIELYVDFGESTESAIDSSEIIKACEQSFTDQEQITKQVKRLTSGNDTVYANSVDNFVDTALTTYKTSKLAFETPSDDNKNLMEYSANLFIETYKVLPEARSLFLKDSGFTEDEIIEILQQ